MNKIKRIITYVDNGADIRCLKKYWEKLSFIRYPYDGGSRPARDKKKWEPCIAKPAGGAWKNAHTRWEENCFTWEEDVQSEIQKQISEIVGHQNEEDILHVDSAYKSKAEIFLTSDNDIFLKKDQLERVCGFKIFNSVKEFVELIDYINKKS